MHMPGLLHLFFPLFLVPLLVPLRRLQLLRPDSRIGVRGPEQGNFYSKCRYEPGLCRSLHITLGRTKIRRVAGVLNYPRSLLQETHGIELRGIRALMRFFIDILLSRRVPSDLLTIDCFSREHAKGKRNRDTKEK